MYKTRIRQWGLAKHLTRNVVSTALRDYGSQTTAADKPTTVLIRGRPIDSKKVEQYLRRSGQDIPWGKARSRRNKTAAKPTQDLSQDSLQHVDIPAPRRLSSPDTFCLPEEIMLLTSNLVAGSRDGRIWVTDADNNLIFSTDTLVQWEHQLSIGRYLLVTKRYKHAFKILDGAFAMLESLRTYILKSHIDHITDISPKVANYEPSLFIYLFINALDYPLVISQRLFSFAADMTKAKLSPHHPLALVWDKLKQVDMEQLKKSAYPILMSYVNNLERLGKSDKNLPFVTYWLLNDIFNLGFVGEDECLLKLKAIINQCELTGCRNHVLQAKTIMGNIFMWAKKYSASRAVLQDVIKSNRTDTGEAFDKGIEKQTFHQYFQLCMRDGSVEEAIKAGQDYLQFLSGYRGAGHFDIVLAASRFQIYLDKHGLPSDDLILEEYLNPDWDVFCGKILSS
jgi:hypothetical protein